MEFTFQKFIQRLVESLLWATFLAIAIQAVVKYLDEPVSSQLFTTVGDDDEVITYPKLAFCQEVPNMTLLDHCRNGKIEVAHALIECMKANNFSLDDYIRASKIEPKNIIKKVVIGSSKSQSPPRKLEVESMWTQVEDWIKGPCLQFDLHKVPGYERIQKPDIYGELDSITFELSKKVLEQKN